MGSLPQFRTVGAALSSFLLDEPSERNPDNAQRNPGAAMRLAENPRLRIITAKIIISDAAPARALKTEAQKAQQNQYRASVGNESLTTSPNPLNDRAVSLGTRTPTGHSGWRSES